MMGVTEYTYDNRDNVIAFKDPKGNILASVDLPPKEVRIVKVNLTEAGTYPFYCDKFLHTSLGMKGEIEVSD